jgi:exonuclease III
MVKNPGLNNTYRTLNNNTHDVHNQSNKKPILSKQDITLTIFHKNICGLLKKKDELLNSLTQNRPQIICISEYHLNDEELEGTTLHSYTLGAKFCRRTQKCGGVCIFVQDNINGLNINIDRYSNEKDIERGAVKLHI